MSMPAGKYSIKDLEKLSGIKAHTIRIWEKRYGVVSPERTAGNIRLYSNEDLRHLLNVSLLNHHGFKISAISQMSAAEIARQVSAIGIMNGNGGIEEQLLLSLIEMDEQKFNASFMKMLVQYGFEVGMAKVIFPFFQRIGIMWQSGAINPAQEHFFSNLIRNKIIAATDSLMFEPKAGAKVLLFLPEQELHELGLLFYNYALRARGFHTIYLGQSVPGDSLDRVIAACEPQYIVTGVTNPLSGIDFTLFAQQLSKVAPRASIFFTGPVPVASVGKRFPNVFFTDDLLRLMDIKP